MTRRRSLSMAVGSEPAIVASDLEPGARFTICVDRTGRTFVRTIADVGTAGDEIGITTYEIYCHCHAIIAGTGSATSAGVKLRLLHNVTDAMTRGSSYVGKIAAIMFDDAERPRLSVKCFVSADDARRLLTAKPGRWLIVSVDAHGLRPRLAHPDPFTTQVACPDSFVAWADGCLHGPFVGDRGDVDAWIRMHCTSGYYAALVLRREAVIDNGAVASDDGSFCRWPEIRQGDCVAFRRDVDGNVRLRYVCADVANARRAVGASPGRWLLAVLVDTVPLH